MLSQLFRVPRLKQHAGRVHNVHQARNPARDHGYAARHGLEGGNTETLPVRGLHVDDGALQETLDVVTAAQEMRPVRDPHPGGELLQFRPLRSVAD